MSPSLDRCCKAALENGTVEPGPLGPEMYRASLLCRALEGGLEMLPGGFRLLPVVPVECYERAAEHFVITSIFAAVETNPADKFSIGALGQWRPVSELLHQVHIQEDIHAHRISVQTCV